MEHELLQTLVVDRLLATCISLSGIAIVIYLAITTLILDEEQDIRALQNCVIPLLHRIMFLALLAIPTFYFYQRGMSCSATATAVVALLSFVTFTCLNLRAKALLRHYKYLP